MEKAAVTAPFAIITKQVISVVLSEEELFYFLENNSNFIKLTSWDKSNTDQNEAGYCKWHRLQESSTDLNVEHKQGS